MLSVILSVFSCTLIVPPSLLFASSSFVAETSSTPPVVAVAYVSFENNRAQVFVQNLASGKRDLVLSSRSSVSAPAWSPDNKYLALASTMDGNSEIYLVEIRK